MIKAGSLKDSITIQRFKKSKNEYGEVIEDWQNLVTVRANIEPLTSREYFKGGQLNSEFNFKILIRYTDVTIKDRIIFNDEVYDITSVSNIKNANRAIEILARYNNKE